MTDIPSEPVPSSILQAEAETQPYWLRPLWLRPAIDIDLTSMVLSRNKLTLAWIPSWYSQDQPLFEGLWRYYHLRAMGPPALKSAMEDARFHGLFDSGFDSTISKTTFEIAGRIDRITHGKLGDLRGLTWGHCMYLVTLMDGTKLVLDDEERAGHCGIDGIVPRDWNLRIEMTVEEDHVKWMHEARQGRMV